MILDLFDFSRLSQEASGALTAVELSRLDLANREGGVRWQARGGRDQQGHDTLEVEIDGHVNLVCQRCLEPMQYPVEINARYRVMRSEEEADAAPLDDDEFDPVVGARDFDLTALIEDEVLLSLPVVPRHDRCPETTSVAALLADDQGGAETGNGGKPSPFAVLSGLKTGGGKKN